MKRDSIRGCATPNRIANQSTILYAGIDLFFVFPFSLFNLSFYIEVILKLNEKRSIKSLREGVLIHCSAVFSFLQFEVIHC
jgi:hypothetical protein